jgi:hypothetical protein
MLTSSGTTSRRQRRQETNGYDEERFSPRGAPLFTTGFHTHLVFGLAGRSGIIFHARPLLIAANFAA